MKFAVQIQRSARRDYNTIVDYIGDRSQAGALAWGQAFDQALARLEESADTMARAQEDEFVDFEVREILFKTRRGLVYRALFTITERTVQYCTSVVPARIFSPQKISSPRRDGLHAALAWRIGSSGGLRPVLRR